MFKLTNFLFFFFFSFLSSLSLFDLYDTKEIWVVQISNKLKLISVYKVFPLFFSFLLSLSLSLLFFSFFSPQGIIFFILFSFLSPFSPLLSNLFFLFSFSSDVCATKRVLIEVGIVFGGEMTFLVLFFFSSLLFLSPLSLFFFLFLLSLFSL